LKVYLTQNRCLAALTHIRTVVVRDERGTRLYSRTEKPMDRTYPELVEALGAGPALVADGEVVAFEGAQTSFSRLQARLGLNDPDRARATGVAVYLYLFDVMVVEGRDVTGLALRSRKKLLRAALNFADPTLTARRSSNRPAPRAGKG
jgi:ATP-dependent DNA ligase